MKLDIQKYAITKSTTFEESNLDATNNTSTLKITIKFSANNQVTNFSSATLQCTCNGVTQSKTVSHPVGGEAKKTFTFDNIRHDSDGSKTVSWNWSCATGTSVLGTIKDSGSKKLTTLHTPPTLNSILITETNGYDNLLGSDWYIIGLSKKQVALNVSYEDNATFKNSNINATITSPQKTSSITIDNYTTNPYIFDLPLSKIDVTQRPYIVLNQLTAKFKANVTDSKNGTSNYLEYNQTYKIDTYSPVTINGSAKREGQTSGQVSISLNGTFQNSIIGEYISQSGSYKPTIKYKFWEAGQNEPNWDDISVQVVELNSSQITASSGEFEINSLDIGSTTPGEQQSGSYYFDYEKSYKIKMLVKDTFTEAETSEITITVGIPVWSEYPDHVDFNKITVQQEPIITIDTYEEYTGATASDTTNTIIYDVSKTGYTPIGIVGINCDHSRASLIRLFRWYINGNEANVSYRNVGTNPLVANDTSITIWVAYIRS